MKYIEQKYVLNIVMRCNMSCHSEISDICCNRLPLIARKYSLNHTLFVHPVELLTYNSYVNTYGSLANTQSF